jgi:hypothetical protein
MFLRDLLCNFDWGVFWTGLQALAVVVGLVIAFFQLKSFLGAERSKVTIALLSKFSDELEDAYRKIMEPDPNRARENNRIRMEAYYKDHSADVEWREAMIDICNYFNQAGDLFESHALHRNLFLSEFAAATQGSYTALADALVVFYKHENHTHLPFYRLAVASGHYIHKNASKIERAMNKIVMMSTDPKVKPTQVNLRELLFKVVRNWADSLRRLFKMSGGLSNSDDDEPHGALGEKTESSNNDIPNGELEDANPPDLRAEDNSDSLTARATRNLTLVTLALVIVNIGYIIVSAGQLGIMKGQLGTMQVDQRPWVSATPAIDEVLMADWNRQKSVSVKLKFSLHNYGRLPAQDFNFNWMIAPWPGNAHHGNLDDPQEKLCADAQRATTTRRQKTTTVFPDRDTTVEDNLTVGGQFVGVTEVIYSIYGCIDYTYSSGQHGQTLFRYTLGKVEHDIWVGLPFKHGPRIANAPVGLTMATVPRKDYYFEVDPDGGNFVR